MFYYVETLPKTLLFRTARLPFLNTKLVWFQLLVLASGLSSACQGIFQPWTP